MSFEGVYEMDVYSEDELRTVLATMQKLKGSYREILHLRHWSGLSFKEIAGVMGGTESSVRVTHHRALESLKAKMPH
jgi:RNA polymerase sigma-70 factor (ECF subfamily)